MKEEILKLWHQYKEEINLDDYHITQHEDMKYSFEGFMKWLETGMIEW